MSHKFDKDRSVSYGYCKIPIVYTGIKHPNHPYKELVLMDRIGKSYTACWHNGLRSSVGREFLVLATDKGFVFKDKEYPLKNIVL